MAQAKSTDNKIVGPGENGYVDPVPSGPDQYEPVYPQLGKPTNHLPEAEDQNAADEKQSEDSEVYEMCEGITAMDDLKSIELQPEGVIVSPAISREKGMPSFIPTKSDQPLNIEKMAKTLHDSIGFFKSKQKRVDAFTNMILSTNKQQRQAIKHHYEEKYKCALSKTIQKNFKGIMRELLVFLIMSEEEFMVQWIEVALQKKDINLLTLIVCTQNNQMVQSARALFDSQNKKSMQDKIDGLTSNIFHRKKINKFLLKLLNAKRESEDANVDMELVEKDVKELLSASKSKKKLNKETYIDIFAQRSLQHLYVVSKKFEEQKSSLIDTVQSLFKESSQTGYAVTVVLYFATRTFDLFSDVLAQTVHEPGPNYCMFLRVIVERCDMDLSNIIQLYGANAMKNFIELNLKKKDADAARIVSKLCGF
eukprot:319615_1